MPHDDMFASSKSRLTTMLLGGILGVFGAHRFHVGRPASGALMALTLGGCGIWYLYDCIVIASGSFRDGEGRLVSDWDPQVARLIPPGTAASILDELDALRAEVGELQDRVAFSERLLTDPIRRPPIG